MAKPVMTRFYEYIIGKPSGDIHCRGADAINYSRIMGYPTARALFVNGVQETSWKVISYSGEQEITYYLYKNEFTFDVDKARKEYDKGATITRYKIRVYDDTGKYDLISMETFEK